jgi:xanthine dehydrogenase YagS FAD-binding subunit
VTEESFHVAADAELAEARTGRDNAYKVPLAVNTLASVLRELTEEAR